MEAEYNWEVKIDREADTARYFKDVPADIISAIRLLNITKKKFGKVAVSIDSETSNVDIYIEPYTTRIDSRVRVWNSIYCEIKPLLGDDYPCVLRKMKSQIALTDVHCKKEDEKQYEDSKTYNVRNIKIRTHPTYVLLLGAFEAESATFEQLKKIFGQSGIEVVLVSELDAVLA
jgi:hypothetical protein